MLWLTPGSNVAFEVVCYIWQIIFSLLFNLKVALHAFMWILESQKIMKRSIYVTYSHRELLYIVSIHFSPYMLCLTLTSNVTFVCCVQSNLRFISSTRKVYSARYVHFMVNADSKYQCLVVTLSMYMHTYKHCFYLMMIIMIIIIIIIMMIITIAPRALVSEALLSAKAYAQVWLRDMSLSMTLGH